MGRHQEARTWKFDDRNGHDTVREGGQRGVIELGTTGCVARARGNHDGTKIKGYWIVGGEADWALFIDWAGV